MEARELRIGNLYHNNVEWLTLTKKDLIFLLTEDNEHYAEPIPLTEEWLLKFNITKVWVFEIFGDNNRGFHISSEGGEWIMIEYVHQLQNLHYSLTGIELTLSSPQQQQD